MNKEESLLYRKENTKVYNSDHLCGKDFKSERAKLKNKYIKYSSMHGKKQRGLDYSPLGMFLLSHVGDNWDDVFKEAQRRLKGADKQSIFYFVAKNEFEKRPIVRCGESSYYSGLYVDDKNILQKVDPTINNENLHPQCACCTYTFNGKKLKNKYDESCTSFIIK